MNDKEILENIVVNKVLPNLDDFIEAEEAFVLYAEFADGESGLRALVTPLPGLDDLEDVMKEIARNVYEETQQLPHYIVACEKIRYIEAPIDEIESGLDDIKIAELDRGIIVVALKAETAEGFASLYSLPDLVHVSTKTLNDENDNAPPYTMLAISSYMHETIVAAGLVEEEEEEEEEVDIRRHSDVKFNFSRN